MRTSITRFECDRCHSAEEKNIDKYKGTLISFTHTHDMHYGNNTTGAYDLCQKCTTQFVLFMGNKK